jgi:hypothetical protein
MTAWANYCEPPTGGDDVIQLRPSKSALPTSTVSSVEQSSMTRISSGGNVCAAALRMARPTMPGTL